MTKLEASVRELISLYVEGYISADALNDALPGTSELDEAKDIALMRLVVLTIGYLAEYQAGELPEDALRAALEQHGGGWRLQRVIPADPDQAEPEAQVRVGADTPLQAVPA
jgi:hypothetical protein